MSNEPEARPVTHNSYLTQEHCTHHFFQALGKYVYPQFPLIHRVVNIRQDFSKAQISTQKYVVSTIAPVAGVFV